MLKRKIKKNSQKAFTLIELLLVMAIVTTLFGIGTLSLSSLTPLIHSEVSTSLLISDIKAQQIKAMVGDTEGRGTPDNYGVKFLNNSYVLFHGQSYSASNSSNFTIPMDPGFSLSTTFSNNIIVFASGSGEILNFINNQNTITATSSAGNSKSIDINKLGVITNIN